MHKSFLGASGLSMHILCVCIGLFLSWSSQSTRLEDVAYIPNSRPDCTLSVVASGMDIWISLVEWRCARGLGMNFLDVRRKRRSQSCWEQFTRVGWAEGRHCWTHVTGHQNREGNIFPSALLPANQCCQHAAQGWALSTCRAGGWGPHGQRKSTGTCGLSVVSVVETLLGFTWLLMDTANTD